MPIMSLMSIYKFAVFKQSENKQNLKIISNYK